MNKKLSTMLLTGACMLFTAPAFAQSDECTTDADCSNGYTCEEIGAETCPAIACAPGEECEQPDCDSQVIMGCVPPPPEQCDPAQGSMACGGGLVCVTYTFEACSGGGSSVGGGSVEPGGDGGGEPPSMGSGEDGMTGSDMGSDDEDNGGREGGPDDEPNYECMTEQESYCVPPYLAPCQADADCGAGFTCEADVICEPCAVSATCMIDENGNEVCEEEPTDCESSCEPSGTSYCQIQEVMCDSDADCAQGFICESFGGGEDVGAPCYTDEMGNTNCEEPEPSTPESYCLPADWERWVGGYGGGAEEGGVDYDSAVTNAGGRGEDDGWNLVDAEVSQESGTNADGDANGEEADAGGCQSAGQSGNGMGLGLLAALGMMLGLRRRKK